MMQDRSGQQIDNYRLIKLLGRGSFGEVYLGEHIYRRTPVAVKILNTSLATEQFYDFINEARIFRLQHPHIVVVLDFGIDRVTGIPFIIMKYAPNGTLRQRHQHRSQLPLAQIVQYVNQMAAALQYAHEENLIHRDVKPENMLLDESGNVLLSDFGIAVVAQNMHYAGETSQAPVGTPHYMAPEQFQGKPSRASDQYSLGIVVYEWLSGIYPFGGTAYELFGQHFSVSPPPLPSTSSCYSPELERIVFKALAKQPQDRYVSVWGFAAALNAYYQQWLHISQGKAVIGATKEYYLQEGTDFFNQLRYADAIVAYNHAIELDPDYALAYNDRGLVYRQLRDYPAAIANYNRSLEINAHSASTYNNRGYVYELMHEYQAAIADYDRAIAIDPTYVVAYNNRGNSYCALGVHTRAIADYSRTIELNPAYPNVYYNRGNAYDELGEPQKAIADFDHAIELDPKYVNAYNNRGYVYRNLGNYQEALANYNQALKLDPVRVSAYNGRGITYSLLEEYSRALMDFDHALELDPAEKLTPILKADLLSKLQQQKKS